MIDRIRRTLDTLLLAGLATVALALASGCGQSAPEGGTISAAALETRIESGDAPLILDVRSKGEFDAGHIPGAINIPHDQLEQRLGELPPDRDTEIIVHCQTGRRAAIAEDVLAQAGYGDVRDLEGHWAGWSAAGLPTE